MKTIFAAILIAIGSCCGAASDLDDLLPELAPDSYTMADNSILTLSRRDAHDSIAIKGGAVIAELAKNEIFGQVIQSKNGKFLLILLETHRGAVHRQGRSASLGLDYSGLALVSQRDGGWQFTRLKFPADGNRVWVRELGTVNADGTQALLRLGRTPKTVGPYTVDYSWETWDLSTMKLLRKGLPE